MCRLVLKLVYVPHRQDHLGGLNILPNTSGTRNLTTIDNIKYFQQLGAKSNYSRPHLLPYQLETSVHREWSNLSSHGFGNKCRLHLPPEATPLTAVLVGVPHLKDNINETTDELIRKIKFWCTRLSDGGAKASSHIIMARQVRWVCHDLKMDNGDCVVVNFNQVNVAWSPF